MAPATLRPSPTRAVPVRARLHRQPRRPHPHLKAALHNLPSASGGAAPVACAASSIYTKSKNFGAFFMRTCYTGQVSLDQLDQTVTLFGWVHRRRDHGGVIFID